MTDAQFRALVVRVNLLERRLGGFIGGGTTVTPHAAQHEDGGSDPLNVTDLAGYTQEGAYVFAFGSATAPFDPADATTYIFGDRPALNPVTGVSETLRVTMPKAGTARIAYGIFPITGTLGSSGNSTITLHNRTAVTSQTISSTVALTANPTRFNNTAMTLAFSAGDELDISWLTPTWATNPTDVFGIIHLYVEFS